MNPGPLLTEGRQRRICEGAQIHEAVEIGAASGNDRPQVAGTLPEIVSILRRSCKAPSGWVAIRRCFERTDDDTVRQHRWNEAHVTSVEGGAVSFGGPNLQGIVSRTVQQSQGNVQNTEL